MLDTEPLITLQQACLRYPGYRGAAHKHASTLTRYILKGARATSGGRVKLEAVRDGGRFLTSLAALARFHAALNDSTAAAVAPKSQFDKDAEAAERELERLGGFKRRAQ